MPRLPQPGGDQGTWGQVLNDFLSEAHNADGSLKEVPQSKVTGLTASLDAKADSSAIPTTPEQVGAEPEGLSDETKAELSATIGQQVTPGLHVVNGRGLRRWAAALGGARRSLATITALGDSITYGAGANDTASTDDPLVFRTDGYVGQLREMFQGDGYADPGEGYYFRYTGGYTTAGGAASHGSSGPYAGSFRLTATGQTLTVVTATPGTSIEFWTWNGSTASARTYTVDGGSPVNFTPGAGDVGLVTWTKHVISGLSDDMHTVVFNGANGGDLYIAGISVRRGTRGVLINRLGRSGNTTANLVGMDANAAGSAAARTRILESIYKVTPADLYIIALGTNDYSRQNSLATTEVQPGTTPATYRANLQQVADMLIAQGGSVLLVGEPRTPNTTTPETYTQEDYYAEARGIAETTDHCAFVDVGEVWGTAAEGLSLGLYPAGSTVHPSKRGHGSMADILHRVLTVPAGVGAPGLI